eukprot:CFRG3388T1
MISLWLAILVPGFVLAQTEQTFEIGLRTLILSSDEALAELPESIAMAYGASYDLVHLDKTTNMTMVLMDSVSNKPKYNSIVQTSPTLAYGYNDHDNNWVWVADGLGDEGREIIYTYCSDYGVRRVLLNSFPYDITNWWPLGLGTVGNGMASNGNTSVEFATNGALATDVHNNVQLNAKIRVGDETEFSKNNYWFYPAEVDTSRGNGGAQPLLNINYNENGKMLQAVGAVVVNDAGREDMVFFFTMNKFGLCGQTLAHMWFPWVNRGIFLGQRRVVLDTQVDDFFLDTSTYNTTYNRQASSDEYEAAYGYRVTETDVNYHAELHKKIRDDLTEGSNFTIQLAFNGIGYDEFRSTPEYEPNGNPATLARFEDFLWCTHTWSHIDMYCIESKCGETPQVPQRLKLCPDWRKKTCAFLNKRYSLRYPTSGLTPYEYNLYELTRNQYFAKKTLKIKKKFKSKVWSPKSLVTPRISGLNYTESIKAMLEAGYRYAVGDNSRLDLKPEHPWHTFVAQVKGDKNLRFDENGRELNPMSTAQRESFEKKMLAKYGVKSIHVIPRFATRVYFDTSLPEENIMEHNKIYISWYGRNLTIDELMGIEGFETARNLLSMRPDPYMFHQANMRTFQGVDGVTHSLLEMWIHSALNWVKTYTTFPVLTYKMDDLAEQYRLRMERDSCDLKATISYENGQPSLFKLTNNNTPCVAKLTHTTTSSSDIFTPIAETSQNIYSYGPYDRTYDVPVRAKVLQRLNYATKLRIFHCPEISQSVTQC